MKYHNYRTTSTPLLTIRLMIADHRQTFVKRQRPAGVRVPLVEECCH